MIEVSLVPAEYVDTCWEKIEKFIEKAAKYTYGRYTTGNIYDLVKKVITSCGLLTIKVYLRARL